MRRHFPHKLGILEKVYGQIFAQKGISGVRTLNGIIRKMNWGHSSHRWIVYGDYEGTLQMNWIRSWLARGGVFVDSGANIGQMLLNVAPLHSVRVLAVQPVPKKWND